MERTELINKVKELLEIASDVFIKWLSFVFPKVSENWWQTCVLEYLTFSQKIQADQIHAKVLEDFSLETLLQLANKAWYDIATATYVTDDKREAIRVLMEVIPRWNDEVPASVEIVQKDLKNIRKFLRLFGGEAVACSDIAALLDELEYEDSLFESSSKMARDGGQMATKRIEEKDIVYIVSNPETRGMVFSVTDLGDTIKYEVFVDGGLQTFYTEQIALVDESPDIEWTNAEYFRSMLAAYQINNPSAQNLYSLNAARIDFVPYQFRPALKLIHADEPRILIADSVGVGKTIEAGLIVKELAARKDLERILIICPRPLVAERKWELEMKRFDEEFVPLSGVDLRQAISDTDRDGEWPVRFSKAIIPYSILDGCTYTGESSKRSKTYGLKDLDSAPHFDLVIVDEAHHIRNGSMEKEKAFAYKCTKYFCDHADAVVMLTATPLQTSDTDLFTLMNVLRPDIFIDEETFDKMSKPNKFIFQCSQLVRSADDDWQKKAVNVLKQVEKTQWGEAVIANNPMYGSVIERLERKHISREERVQLISDVETLHSLNTMFNRTRRRDIQDFCVRRAHTVEIDFTEKQQTLHDILLEFNAIVLEKIHHVRMVPFMISMLRRQAASCIFGLAPQIEDIIARRFAQLNSELGEEFDLSYLDDQVVNAVERAAQKLLKMAQSLPKEDPKFDAMLDLIEQKNSQDNNKIILFSTFRHTLKYLYSKLVANGYRVEQVDGSVKDAQRYAFKARFELPKSDPDAIDILLFTEVGSEGLDYQFCDMMINYDLPWNPMRIEQRIGRIDRRGQQSEVVNIYNMITSGTVDAEIYHRCLMRIGVFENSIGECEDILGDIATQIEQIAVDSSLTELERNQKLAQMADNEVRKMQEMTRLEDEEKDLFGFDLSEFTTAKEIKDAENIWLAPQQLRKLVEQYLEARLGTGRYILGEDSLKNLRLSAKARPIILEDAQKLSGGKNAVRSEWEHYLKGKKPIHAITFDADTAERNRDCFFITTMHPLVKQAAQYFANSEAVHIALEHTSDSLPEGSYLFSVYVWKYTGLQTNSQIVPVCENEMIVEDLSELLQYVLSSSPHDVGGSLDWLPLEKQQVKMWKKARVQYIEEVQGMAAFKLESLESNHHRQIEKIQQQIMRQGLNESVKRMKESELENVEAAYRHKVAVIKQGIEKADIHTMLLANGVITIKKG